MTPDHNCEDLRESKWMSECPNCGKPYGDQPKAAPKASQPVERKPQAAPAHPNGDQSISDPLVLSFLKKVNAEHFSITLSQSKTERRYGTSWSREGRTIIYCKCCGSWVQARETLCHELAHLLAPSVWNPKGWWDKHGATWKAKYTELMQIAIQMGMFEGHEVEAKVEMAYARACHNALAPNAGTKGDTYGLCTLYAMHKSRAEYPSTHKSERIEDLGEPLNFWL